MRWPLDRRTGRAALGLALFFAFTGQNALAFDTCIYLDPAGNVLRMTPDRASATLTRPDATTIACSITARLLPGKPRRGTCQDQPDWTFDVFSGTSDPDLGQNDLLAFRGELWSRKCAFTR